MTGSREEGCWVGFVDWTACSLVLPGTFRAITATLCPEGVCVCAGMNKYLMDHNGAIRTPLDMILIVFHCNTVDSQCVLSDSTAPHQTCYIFHFPHHTPFDAINIEWHGSTDLALPSNEDNVGEVIIDCDHLITNSLLYSSLVSM